MGKNNSTYNKNGAVSAYGLACGYAQSYVQAQGWVGLHTEGGVYHVKMVLDGAVGQWNTVGKRWDAFEKLSEARACFVEYCVLVNDLRGKVKGWPWLAAFAENT